MKNKQKTQQWARKHLNDPYVKKANGEGYRSRAVYKFKEIDQQDKLIYKGMTVVDLGAAPGGWSQYIAKKINNSGKIIAIDLLEMEPIEHVDFILGDFRDEEVLDQFTQLKQDSIVDLVISDMAPNITGVRDVDEARYESIVDSIFWFCDEYLKTGGHLLVKLFEGSAAHYYRREANKRFKKNIVRKPSASRAKSREFYMLSWTKK